MSLKLLTLDLTSPARPGHSLTQPQLDALTDADWTEILRMARQHRIGPMMRWQSQHAHPHIKVPKRVADALTKQHKNWTARAMAMQRELLRVHGILEAAGIPHVFLKGAYLAYCVYPHPALRPLRDLDILIPPERLTDARAALIAGGLSTLRRFEVMPESM
ncbi:MAG: nucleotidyltransferase family protein [Actinobacteria bacterium]|nr:nucleotidyltransferase family protein [Actinomycetota bacterium]